MVTSELTPLQRWLTARHYLVAHAHDELDERGWIAFVHVAADLVGIEAGRIAVDEAMKVLEDEAA